MTAAVSPTSFAEIGGIRDVRITMSEPLRIGGQSGYQTMAGAKDTRSGADVMVVQWLRFGSGGFLQMTGIARADTWTSTLSGCAPSATAFSRSEPGDPVRREGAAPNTPYWGKPASGLNKSVAQLGANILWRGICSICSDVMIGLASVTLAHAMLGRVGAAPCSRQDQAHRAARCSSSTCRTASCRAAPGGEGGRRDRAADQPIARRFQNVVLTQDWHTPRPRLVRLHHPGKKPFETIKLPYGTQVLWPDHCVQGTEGAHSTRTSTSRTPSSSSARATTSTSTATRPSSRPTARPNRPRRLSQGARPETRVRAGLATDFCVAWTALDARKAGFAAVIEDACRGIDVDGSLAKAWADMNEAGVKKIQSSDLAV